MKKKVIIAVNILIIIFAVLLAFGTISRGNKVDIDRNVIYAQDRSEGLDLSLRQYIDKINNKELVQIREPNVKIVNKQIQYQHDKRTVYINQGDTIVYNIRVYNEGTIDGKANKITQYLPEGIEFNAESVINLKYGWKISEDGRVATTEYLAVQNIPAYAGGNNVNYKELSIECTVNVKDEKQNKRLVNIAEITETSDSDIDSVPGNITEQVSSEYLLEESKISDNTSYIVGEEDDNDFESINIAKNVPIEYAIRINKIDDLTNELLNGAKFDLLDENKNVIQTGVTANGGVLDFGMKKTTGEGEDIYYIKEINTPPGYKNTIKYTLKLIVKREFVSESNLQTTIEADLEDIDVDTSKYKEIPIYTKEQLRKIGNNEEVYIEQADATYKFDNTKRYTLMQDIDLQSENWTPIEGVEDVMLDGNNHKISNLKIENTNTDIKKFGLFSTYSGIIENLTLDNVDIDITKEDNTEQVTEEDINAVGGIVGYLETGILKNCRVTGEINASVDNVGGLVGHTKEESLTVFRDCVNETNIIVDGSNAGGLLGCSLGEVNVVNSQNKGQISVTTYNAGGLIGCADPKSYTPEFVQVGYDSTSKVISVVVKNEIISGKYNLRLEKVDESEQANLLNGAKFNLYDSKKNIIEEYRNVTFEDGVLELPKTINSLVPDVYYLKEVEAPTGYTKISEEYIKIEISKGWNYNTEEYTVDSAKITTLSEEELKQEQINNENEVGSGEIYSETLTGIIWRVDKVNILENSKNEGTIRSANLNSAGFLGRAKATITIKNSSNEGEIYTELGNAAGMVGQAENQDGEISKLYVENSNNNGTINQTTDEMELSVYTTAGIVARVESNVEINNSNNYGTITAKKNAVAGIIGLSYSNSVVLDTCTNAGNISTEGVSDIDLSSADAGGMIAKNFVEKDVTGNYNSIKNNEKTILRNCSNIANITAYDHSGGMIGNSNVTKIEINNCKTENSNINVIKGDIGGIIGLADVDVVNIRDCIIRNNVIRYISEDTYESGAVGGIIGAYEKINKDSNTQSLYLTIDNCDIFDTEIYTKKNTGGIIGIIKSVNHEDASANINGCDIDNLTVKTQPNKYSYANCAGILATAFHIKDVIITNCNVGESNIILNTDGRHGNVSGICAMDNLCIEDKDTNLIIKNCNVNSSNIEGNYIEGQYGSSTSAIVASTNASTIIIENTDITDIDLTSNGSNTAGILATAYPNSEDKSGKLIINNCNADNLNLENGFNPESFSSEKYCTITAGLMGISCRDYTIPNTIQNCSVKNSTILGKGHNTAGAISVIDGSANIDNIEVENTNIKSTATFEESNYQSVTAGILANMLNRKDVLLMSNCIVNECEINGRGINIGGIVGWAYKDVELENCKVLSSIITDELDMETTSDIETARGGIIASTTGFLSMTECSVSNTDISGIASSVGGLVGYASGIKDISNCNYENGTITGNYFTTLSEYGSVGGIIGASESASEEGIHDSSVIKAIIQSNANTIGGIIGTINSSCAIKNCTVNEFEVLNTNTETNTKYDSSVGALIGVGVVETKDNAVTIESTNVSNININISEGNKKIQAGGLFGYIKGNLILENENNINDINISNNTNGDTGGIIGMLESEGESAIKNITLENLEIIGYAYVGGIVGSNADNSPITRCTVNNSTIIGKDEPVGGIVGNNGNSSIIECRVNNTTIKGNTIFIIGEIKGTGNGEEIDCEIENVTKEQNITE